MAGKTYDSSPIQVAGTAEVAPYAQEAMWVLVERGIVNGMSGTLCPLGISTRAQMAQILYTLLSK